MMYSNIDLSFCWTLPLKQTSYWTIHGNKNVENLLTFEQEENEEEEEAANSSLWSPQAAGSVAALVSAALVLAALRPKNGCSGVLAAGALKLLAWTLTAAAQI